MTDIQILYSGPVVNKADAKKLELKRFFTGEPCRNNHIDQRFVSDGSCVKCNFNRTYKSSRNRTAERRGVPVKMCVDGVDQPITSRQYAKSHGLDKYFTGFRCSNGHISLRLVSSGSCCECKLDERRRNKSKYIISDKRYLKVWMCRNKDKVRNYSRNRRAKKITGGTHTPSDIEYILYSQTWNCVYCGVSLKGGYHVDHIMPLCLGGSNEPNNLQCLCPSCNMSKGGKHPDEWHRSIGYMK